MFYICAFPQADACGRGAKRFKAEITTLLAETVKERELTDDIITEYNQSFRNTKYSRFGMYAPVTTKHTNIAKESRDIVESTTTEDLTP